MKKGVNLFTALLLFSAIICAQTIENIDYISDFNDGLAAIKKNNQWAFINKEGDIVIDFRNDLVTTKFNDGDFPIFYNERCLIKKEHEGISYFGYIDTYGKTVIESQYLNAYNFNNDEAIVLVLIKQEIGENEALGKNIVYYRYYEAVIDINGHVKVYLTPKGFNVVLDKQHLRTPPKITSRRILDNLYAILNDNKKWTIQTIKDLPIYK